MAGETPNPTEMPIATRAPSIFGPEEPQPDEPNPTPTPTTFGQPAPKVPPDINPFAIDPNPEAQTPTLNALPQPSPTTNPTSQEEELAALRQELKTMKEGMARLMKEKSDAVPLLEYWRTKAQTEADADAPGEEASRPKKGTGPQWGTPTPDAPLKFSQVQ
jgi:hypothetical protein